MHPLLFKIGNFEIFSYGVIFALSFGIFVYLASLEAKKARIPSEKITDLGILILISGIIGARAFFVMSNLNYFLANPVEIIMLHHGGLVFYGGFLVAFLSSLIFVKINNLSFWKVGDLLAPYFALGQSIGRIGCFLNGCCYGKKTLSILGVHFPGIEGNVWPTQLMSSAGLLIIFILLTNFKKVKHFEGFILLSYFLLYSAGRFLVEFLRGDNPQILFNLTCAQIISIAVFFLTLLIFIRKASKWKVFLLK